jgi:hypothetical protein
LQAYSPNDDAPIVFVTKFESLTIKASTVLAILNIKHPFFLFLLEKTFIYTFNQREKANANESTQDEREGLDLVRHTC